jgi:predicted deacylase
MTTLQKPDIASIRQGNTGVSGVWRFDSKTAGPATLITALIHGNEICGPWAIKDLIESLQAKKFRLSRGSLTLALCNLEAFDRFDPDDLHASRFIEEDMNRVWSNDKLQSQATVERRRANALLPFIANTDYLLDLHSMHDPGEPLLLTGLARRDFDFAKQLNLPGHIIVDAGHSEGVRLRDFQANTTSLLVECGFHLDNASKTIAKLAVARFLVATGQVDLAEFDRSWLLAEAQEDLSFKQVAVTHAIVAKSNDMQFKQAWQNMQTIPKEGQLLAVDGTTIFRTPYDNCTLVMPSLKQLRPGVTVMRLAKNAFQT